MTPEDFAWLSIRELGARLRSRKLSSFALTEAYLERSERIGARLNAYATLTRDLALSEARRADRELQSGHDRGPLHGIPYAAKDLLAVRGYPTTWGAKPYARQTFDYDATVIRKLRDAGAVLIGKAAMIELAGGMGYRYASASLTGAAKNPWKESCWTCGSSSGSGAIASAGLAAFAIGTETWGSILCPSAFCGVAGLRPTYGRVSRHGAMALAFSMDKIGVLARTADDCALVLERMAGHDPEDRSSLPDATFRASEIPDGKSLRIGWVTNAFKELPAGVEPVLAKAKEALVRSGAAVRDIKLPEGPWEAAAGVVVSVEGAAAFSDLIESGRVAELADPLGKIGGYVSRQVPSTDYMRAVRLRALLQKRVDELFDRVDVLACASEPTAATPIAANLESGPDYGDLIGAVGNFCGLPAIGVPCGFVNGLPIGLQFNARPMHDAKAIAAARLFQQYTDWHTKHPPVS